MLLRWMLLGVAVLSFLNTPIRADYNLPLGLFCFLVWEHTYPYPQKTRVFYLLLFSIIADLVWFLSYLAIWNQRPQTMFQAVQITSAFNFVYKFALMVWMVVREEEVKGALTGKGVKDGIAFLFGKVEKPENMPREFEGLGRMEQSIQISGH